MQVHRHKTLIFTLIHTFLIALSSVSRRLVRQECFRAKPCWRWTVDDDECTYLAKSSTAALRFPETVCFQHFINELKGVRRLRNIIPTCVSPQKVLEPSMALYTLQISSLNTSSVWLIVFVVLLLPFANSLLQTTIHYLQSEKGVWKK